MTCRILATCRDYGQLMDAFRAWMVELNVAGQTVDDLAGLPDRYTQKLIGPIALKGIGRTSLGPLLGALGLKLILAVDQAALDRIRHRLEPRKSAVHASDKMRPTKSPMQRANLLGNVEWARVMNARRSVLLTPRKRAASARNAARTRWRKH